MLRNLSRRLFVASVISVGALGGLTSCGTARVIQRTQAGGIIELEGDRGKAMEQANQEMAAHCGPGNFTITQEGEEAIGTDTYSREDTNAASQTSRSGRTTTAGSTTTGAQSTRTATAWRVHYQCNGAGGPPPAATAPPPPAAPPPPGGAPPPGY